MAIWDNINKIDRVPVYIGIVVLITVSVLLGFIGTQRVSYAKEFYNLNFAFEFLEDIRPGTKIRYQGALIVGEVLKIKTGQNLHFAIGRLKKDFHIPKFGSRVTLQTWGYFGGKFINIDILPSARGTEYYNTGESVPVEKIVNSTIIMKNIYDYFKKDTDAEESKIEKELIELKLRTQKIGNSPYSRPLYVRQLMRKITGGTRNIFDFITSATNRFYLGFSNVNDSLSRSVEDLKTGVARLKRSTSRLKKDFGYETGTIPSRFLHEEIDYNLILEYSDLSKRMMKDFKEQPYRILFRDY